MCRVLGLVAQASLLQTWGTRLEHPATHQQLKDWSLVHARYQPPFTPLPPHPASHLRFPTLYPGHRHLTQSELSWSQDVKLDCPLWSVHQAGLGWSVLTTAGPWASLGQQRRPSCRKTQSWGTEKIMGDRNPVFYGGQKPSLLAG